MAHKKLAKIYALSGAIWESIDIPISKKSALRSALKCGLGKLGADEYSSGAETRFVPHTCKSSACAECGAKRAIKWIREQLSYLPDIRWLGMTMTMPEQLWPVFRDNQQLLQKLPAFGAHAIDEWSRSHAAAIPFIVVVMQTANGELIFKPHLHIICSSGGMDTSKSKWIDNIGLEGAVKPIMELWRGKVLDYLSKAYQSGFIGKSAPKRFSEHLEWQRTREWHLWTEERTKDDLLNYLGRYVGRPPVSESSIQNFDENGVDFIASVYSRKGNRRQGSEHKKIKKPVHYSLGKFMRLLTNHLPGRYRHNVRYFGLLAPRLRQIAKSVIEANFPQSVSPEAANKSMQRSWSPKDSHGNAMRRIRSVSPKQLELHQKQSERDR